MSETDTTTSETTTAASGSGVLQGDAPPAPASEASAPQPAEATSQDVPREEAKGSVPLPCMVDGCGVSGGWGPSNAMCAAHAKAHAEHKRAEALSMSVDLLDLSVRSRNRLYDLQIETVGELVQKNEIDLLRGKNFGRKSLKEIKDRLGALNLSLAPRPPGATMAYAPMHQPSATPAAKPAADKAPSSNGKSRSHDRDRVVAEATRTLESFRASRLKPGRPGRVPSTLSVGDVIDFGFEDDRSTTTRYAGYHVLIVAPHLHGALASVVTRVERGKRIEWLHDTDASWLGVVVRKHAPKSPMLKPPADTLEDYLRRYRAREIPLDELYSVALACVPDRGVADVIAAFRGDERREFEEWLSKLDLSSRELTGCGLVAYPRDALDAVVRWQTASRANRMKLPAVKVNISAAFDEAIAPVVRGALDEARLYGRNEGLRTAADLAVQHDLDVHATDKLNSCAPQIEAGISLLCDRLIDTEFERGRMAGLLEARTLMSQACVSGVRRGVGESRVRRDTAAMKSTRR